MALQADLKVFTELNRQRSSFYWINKLQEKSGDLLISATAISVLLALLYHYNPEHKYVFPHQDTIAKRIKRTPRTVQRAIAELKNIGYILTLRTEKGNLYGFTQKFFDELETTLCRIQKRQNVACIYRTCKGTCKKEKKQQKKEKKEAVVFSKNSLFDSPPPKQNTPTPPKTSNIVDFTVIPDILKKKAEVGKIRNLRGYWRSLTQETRDEYIELDKQEKQKIARIAEYKRQREQEEREKQAEIERIRKEPPFYANYTKEEALEYCKKYITSPITSRLAHKPDCLGAIVARMHGIDFDALKAKIRS